MKPRLLVGYWALMATINGFNAGVAATSSAWALCAMCLALAGLCIACAWFGR